MSGEEGGSDGASGGLGAPYSEDEVANELEQMLSDPRFQEYVERNGRLRTEPGLFVSGWDRDDEEEEEGRGDMETDDQEFQALKAAEHGDREGLARLLEDNPGLVGARDEDLYTPMHRAAYNNHSEIIQLLLTKNADPMALTEQGWTPLHCAACWGCDKSAQALIDSGRVDANAKSYGNVTPLHLVAASTDDPEGALRTAKLLLGQPGIQLHVKSSGDQYPLDIARRHSGAMLQVFEEAAKTLTLPAGESVPSGSDTPTPPGNSQHDF